MGARRAARHPDRRLAELAAALGLAEADQPDQQAAAPAVRRWLDDHGRWLLVLDNAQAPEAPTGLRAPLARLVDLMPQVIHGQVLVTSRDARWEQHAALAELEVFTPRRRSRSCWPAPAAATRPPRRSPSCWVAAAGVGAGRRLRPRDAHRAGRLPGAAAAVPGADPGQGRPRDRDPADTVATTWQVSLEQVRPGPGAVALLEVCALLSLDPPIR